MSAVIEADGLGKRYRRKWALTDCTLSIPAGHVVGLVGPNGAGKTTLLNLAVGLLAPDAGLIEVLGGVPAADRAQLARVGFLAQDSPVYAGLSVADHLKLGAHLNTGWDAELAHGRVERLDLDPGRKDGTLCGQRAQLALTLAIAKRPGAAGPGRAGRQPGPAGPAGVPAGPDGGGRRAGTVGGAVLAPGRGPGTGLRLPGVPRIAGAHRRAGGRAAGHPPPAVRAAPGPGHAAGQPGGHLGQPHRTCRPRCWCAAAAWCWTPPGRSRRSASRTWCWPT